MRMQGLIDGLEKFGMNREGCLRMQAVCEALDNPQDKLKYVHVGGTNGKGSTCHMIASVLREEGYKVGVYISPALYKFNERITINNIPISDDQLDKYYKIISNMVNSFENHPLGLPTEFEVVTALAFLHFFNEKVDYVVLEVGLGGRLDATNVVIPEISIITNIDLDHTQILGDSIEKIAFEKAGIIKENIPLIIGVMDERAEKVLVDQASKKNSSYYYAKDLHLGDVIIDNFKQYFTYNNEDYQLGLLGKHQLENVKIVLLLFKILKHKMKISSKSLKNGLKKASWPGRFEIVSIAGKKVIFDVAHNPKSMKCLKDNLRDYFKPQPVTFILGIFKDKDIDSMLSYLDEEMHSVVLSKPVGERGLESSLLSIKVKQHKVNILHVNDDLVEAVEYALNVQDEIICICGSFNTVGPARNYLLNKYLR